MKHPEQPQQPNQDEQDIARVLQAVGPREELPRHLKESWEEEFRQSLQPVLDKRRQLRKRWAMGPVASLLLAVGLLFPNLYTPNTGKVNILVTYISGETSTDFNTGKGQPAANTLRLDQALTPGTTVTTGPQGWLALNFNGFDLRLHNNSSVLLGREGIELFAGEVYVSDSDRPDLSQGLVITTPYGTVRDIGTQFTVRLRDDTLVATVRQGIIALSTAGREYKAAATDTRARRLTITQNSEVLQTSVPPGGPDWEWISNSAPRFELEGASAYEFLQWSALETGQRLKFASEGARIYASTILLHGDIGELSPEQAIEPVLATTDLQLERQGSNTLLVSLVRQQ